MIRIPIPVFFDDVDLCALEEPIKIRRRWSEDVVVNVAGTRLDRGGYSQINLKTAEGIPKGIYLL